MDDKDIKLEVGKRYLFLRAKGSNVVYESTVLEISPLGAFVKINDAGGDGWHPTSELLPVEYLGWDHKIVQWMRKEDMAVWLGLDKKQDAQEYINDLRTGWE